MKIAFTLAVLGCMLVLTTNEAHAQCSNAVTPNCSVYKSCFAKYCPCEGSADEYFIKYGEKYCRSFLDSTSLSAEGKAWRDATLVCLQEAIVPKLDISTTPTCDCRSMRKTAFDSHVACYTQPRKSICALPVGDVATIARVIDVGDLMDHAGWRQMRDVAHICTSSAPDDGRRTMWKTVAAGLRLRSP